MRKSPKFSPEVQERAVRMVFDAKDQYPSQWAAIESIAGKIGCTGETLRKWVRQGLSEFLCAGLGDLSTAAGVACDERPTRWATHRAPLMLPS